MEVAIMNYEKQNPLEKTFIIELALLKALAIREHYESYASYVSYDRLLEETKVFLDAYKEYYALYPEHKEIDFDTLLTQFTNNWHARDMHEEQLEFYTKAIIRVKDEPAKDSEAAILGLINKQLIDNINKIANKPFTSEAIRQELELYEKKRSSILQEYDQDCWSSEDVDFASIDKSLGIPYAFPPLSESLGGMVAGSSVVVVAAHGLGKTAFVISQVAVTLKWARQHNKGPILVFTTEGTPSEYFGRQWSNSYKQQFIGGYREILANKEKVQHHFIKTFGKDAILVFTANNKGINYIRTKIKQYNPCLVVLDMAAGIMTSASKTSGETTDLRIFFNTLREMSSSYCPIMSTVQAGVGAKFWDKDAQKYKYKKWPTSEDIYGSKDAVQGAAETIITIGRDDEHEYTRYIQTTKLKAESSPVKFICELERKFSNYKFVSKAGGYDD